MLRLSFFAILSLATLQPVSVTAEQTALVSASDADYLKRKFREDMTNNGLSSAQLAEGGLKLAQTGVAAGIPWPVVKARTFAWLCDHMGVAASEHDFFPAISAYRQGGKRPMMKVLAWRDAQINARYLKSECDAVAAAQAAGRFSMWKDFDHSVPDWNTLLAGGWPMLERRLAQYEKPTPYYQALRLTLDACLRTVERFAAAAHEAAAETAEPEGRKRLEAEAKAFAAIRSNPPHTVYEALAFQFSYFFLSEHLDGLQVRSLGALDQLLAPFYRSDLAAGRITPGEFKTLLAHYWWQWGSIDNYWGQPVALGGTNADGTSAYNEVSELILDVHDELALPTPKMLVKIAASTPDSVFDRLLDLARRHRPVTFDGEETMRTVLKSWRNCTDEECRTCDLNGCYEFYVRGAQNVTQSSHLNLLQPVHDILVRRANGEGPLPMPDFEDFKTAYFEELRRNTLACCELTDAWERHLGEINPANLYSLATESAVRDGKDAYFNGLVYNDTALLSVGLGTTVDALLAVKEIVYERHELSLAELGALMKSNWKGGERLRRRMLRSKRKWGTNDPVANALGAEISRTVGGWVNGRKNSRGGIWGFSGHPARQFIELARQTGATPDGRLAGEETSKNVSATMGMDTEGATALIGTLSHLNPRDLPVNMPLDVMLHPSAASGTKGLLTMRTLAREYFANGGTTIQFNVFSADELKDAQLHPERYENLQVRVCGWNVRWNDMCKAEQDKYITRAENLAP